MQWVDRFAFCSGKSSNSERVTYSAVGLSFWRHSIFSPACSLDAKPAIAQSKASSTHPPTCFLHGKVDVDKFLSRSTRSSHLVDKWQHLGLTLSQVMYAFHLCFSRSRSTQRTQSSPNATALHGWRKTKCPVSLTISECRYSHPPLQQRSFPLRVILPS